VARYFNPELLLADWPPIEDALDPRLRGTCEGRFALGAPGGPAGEPVAFN
jgi:hypothetical protein